MAIWPARLRDHFTIVSIATYSQYASDEITSPPALVPSAHQTGRLIVCLMNATCPSPKPRLTPPGWRLWAVQAPLKRWPPVPAMQENVFGAMT